MMPKENSLKKFFRIKLGNCFMWYSNRDYLVLYVYELMSQNIVYLWRK